MISTWMGRGLGAFAIVTASVLAGGCQTSSPPTIGVRNTSDTLVRVGFWVGQRDRSVSGVSKLKNVETIEAVPGGRHTSDLDPLFEYGSPGETVVRVQLLPAEASFAGVKESWYEFSPLPPYIIVISKTKDGEYVATREGPGTITPVPEKFWPGRAFRVAPSTTTDKPKAPETKDAPKPAGK